MDWLKTYYIYIAYLGMAINNLNRFRTYKLDKIYSSRLCFIPTFKFKRACILCIRNFKWLFFGINYSIINSGNPIFTGWLSLIKRCIFSFWNILMLENVQKYIFWTPLVHTGSPKNMRIYNLGTLKVYPFMYSYLF